jgi:extradiol dioxygenase family protein
LHLSLPVRDLDEARRFYVDVLGCEAGRVRDDWIDVWFYGMQVTLQLRPDEVLTPAQPGVRHFGVTLSLPELHSLLDHIGNQAEWIAPPTTDHAGTPRAQTKAKLADPSGNVIELKSYDDPASALERGDAASAG